MANVGCQPTPIAHLVLSLESAGLEMVVVDLVRATSLDRFRPHIICLRNPGALAARVPAGIPLYCLDCPTLPKMQTLVRLTRLLHRIKPHILHSHNPSPHMFGGIAGRLAGVPVLVHTKHGRNYPHKPHAVLVNRFASQFSDRIVAVSQAAADVATRVERIAPGRLQVIRNGIDLAEFPHPATDGHAVTAEPRRAIHVARLIRLKDQFSLLRATRLVVDRAPDFRLDIIGEGPVRDELLALRSELNLNDVVRLLGFRNDVRALLPQAQMFILCSLSEGISISLLEAMAAGLPCVATDVGGNREVVADHETGLLVPPQSPEALARAMLTLHRSPELIAQMGWAARRRVEQEFSLEQVVARYESLYTELLQQKRSRRGAMRSRPSAPLERLADQTPAIRGFTNTLSCPGTIRSAIS